MIESPDIDRGWAFVVLVGYFLARFLVLGMSFSPGILYDNFLNYYEQSPVFTAWTINLNTFILNMTASLASVVIKTCGCRKTIIIGCLISTFGLLVTSFAPRLIHILFSYGIVTGFGYAMINVSCYPVITRYFVKYRGIVLLLGSSGEAVGQFVLPYLFYSLSNTYSWRGALIVLAGINLNFIVLAAVFMSPRSENEAEEEVTQIENNRLSLSRCHSITASAISCFKTSFLNDLILFKDYSFILVFISYLFCSLAFSGAITHLKAYGLQSGLAEIEATTLLSFVGIFGLIGTVAMTILLQSPRMNVIVLNLIFSICIGVGIFVLAFCETKTSFYTVVAIIGFFCGSVSAFPLVVLTVVGAQNIAAGIGYISIGIAIGCVSGGPIAAALYILDTKYAVSFITLGVSGIIGGLLQIPIVSTTMKPEV